jgi:hypothetical protein
MLTGKHTSFKLDKRIGDIGEVAVLPKLQSYFNISIRKTENAYEKYDYIDDAGTKYELKTRRNRMDAYPTTLIPKHKVIDGSELYFIFSFVDKISYIKYDKELFDTFETRDLIDGRYNYERLGISHYLIPIGNLTPLF